MKSVRSEVKEGNIAYIRVSRFGEDTDALFTEALKVAVRDQSQGIIIDLRNNPGGFLYSAVEMASLMLPSGNIVVMEEDGAGKRKELKARGGDIASSIPTVVLIKLDIKQDTLSEIPGTIQALLDGRPASTKATIKMSWLNMLGGEGRCHIRKIVLKCQPSGLRKHRGS